MKYMYINLTVTTRGGYNQQVKVVFSFIKNTRNLPSTHEQQTRTWNDQNENNGQALRLKNYQLK
jgi:hypothetical protein